MDRRLYRYTESILYSYSTLPEEIFDRLCYQRDIIHETPKKQAGHNAGYISDPTGIKGSRIADDKVFNRLMARFCLIKSCVDTFDQTQRKIFRLKYVQCKSNSEVMRALGMTKTTYYRRIKKLVWTAAQKIKKSGT